jgi:hypothetical protein
MKLYAYIMFELWSYQLMMKYVTVIWSHNLKMIMDDDDDLDYVITWED